MTETVDETPKLSEKENLRECRACLKKMENNTSICNIFQSWVPPWDGMEATIAQDLAKLANIEIMETDNHSQIMCEPCYTKLLDAVTFAAHVRICDQLLKQRYKSEVDSIEKVWPKPIQVDKNIDTNVYQDMNVEIKQEIVSDNEYDPTVQENPDASGTNDTELGNSEIKIEPEEITEPMPFVEPFIENTSFPEPPPLTITINGTMSLKTQHPESKTLLNGNDDYEAIITDSLSHTGACNGDEYYDEQYFRTAVKEEPLSEDDLEQDTYLSLDCLLCTKSFNSVTGLKAHVIAQHSYKSVKRKLGNAESPEKKQKVEYRCQICRRAFVTSTDLMVHETCHNKHSCYVCSRKFDTFKQLSKHRKRCNLPLNKTAVKPKTLDDVMR